MRETQPSVVFPIHLHQPGTEPATSAVPTGTQTRNFCGAGTRRRQTEPPQGPGVSARPRPPRSKSPLPVRTRRPGSGPPRAPAAPTLCEASPGKATFRVLSIKAPTGLFREHVNLQLAVFPASLGLPGASH